LRENFTDFEKQVYDYIKEQGEVLVHNLPKKMMGAIPDLKNAGFLKTYRKPTKRPLKCPTALFSFLR